MINDYESLANLSKKFSENIVANQKRLNQLRSSQFYCMAGDNSKVNIKQIREKNKDFLSREKSQLEILSHEMNTLLEEKIKDFENEQSFNDKELNQQKILLGEIEKEYANMSISASKLSDLGIDTPVMPIVIRVDMLLQKENLSEKQRSHLLIAKQNILAALSGL